MTNTLNVLVDRIWQRRSLVVATTLVVLFGAYLTTYGRTTTYMSRVLVSAASTRPPTQDAILAQGFTYYINDPTYQSGLRQKPGFPSGINNFSAEFVSASPLFYVQVTADTPQAAEAAAPKLAQLYIDDVNGRLDASREATAAAMTTAMMRVWGGQLTANSPSAFTAQVQLQQQIDQLNADGSNRLVILQSGAGATAKGAGKTRTLASGLVGGLLLGCVVAMMAGAATRRLYTEYDVMEKTGVRPFDVIPPGGTAGRDARRQVALRHLANVVARSSTQSPTSVAVAPISPGIGGDMIARSIADHRAAQGVRTVYVDADLRGGVVSSDPHTIAVGSGLGPGVGEYLRGSVADIRELVTESAGFVEIAPGESGTDPYPLFDRDRVRALLDATGAAADLVVVHVPPMSTAPESQIVADLADLTILVIERGQTRVRDVHEAVRALNQVGADVLGAVLVDTSDGRGPERRYRLPSRFAPTRWWPGRARREPARDLAESRTAP
ncbi:CpsD/CapB family tyrosine-protein kinase [Nocardia sp. NPDC051570]|uniref:CpsD/CapB family tyrosine-protein kinase n=1 Tax=Nocardia sp. NPDC051570 TaxID=3364324 RepID=UPI0037B029AC